MPQLSDNFASLVDLDPVLAELFYQQYAQLPSRKDVIFGVSGSTKEKETDQRVGSFGDPPEWDGAMHTQTALPDYEIEYIHKHFVDSFQVDQVTFEDMQYPGIFRSATELATAFQRKQEKDAASVLNNAFSGVTGYDAKVLCADDHPRSKSDSTSVDNKLTAALTSDSLEVAIQQLGALGDDLGEETANMANLLIVPRGLRKTAHELVMSELTPGDANTASNVHEGFQFMVWERLTSSTAWYVVDNVVSKQWLKWFDRIGSSFGADEKSTVMMRIFFARMRYSFGWSDFRWIVGSTGGG